MFLNQLFSEFRIIQACFRIFTNSGLISLYAIILSIEKILSRLGGSNPIFDSLLTDSIVIARE